jgi:LPXTG-motif cell wall-anchored protein
MKKPSTLGAVALAALVAVLAMLGFSAPAQAYPDARVELTVNRSVLYSGQDFTVRASASASCDWSLEWAGDVRTGTSSSGRDFTATYTAAQVTKVTKIPLHGTCVYSSSASTSAASGARTAATWQRTVVITVLPKSTAVSPPGCADLPNTGGPNLLFLVGGLGLLLAGATAVSVARRRAEEAEIQAFGA